MTWMLRIAGVLLSVLVVSTLILVGLGRRAGAGHVSTSVEIKASPDAVFPWLSQDDKASQWIGSLVDAKTIGPRADEVGARHVRTLRDPLIDSKLDVVEEICSNFTPPSRLSFSVNAAKFRGDKTFVLTDLADGLTRLDIDLRYSYKGPFENLLEPISTYLLQKRAEDDSLKLKSLIESAQP